jgi:hypothetical protein
VAAAISFYLLDLLEFQDVRPLSQSDRPSQEILSTAAELEERRRAEIRNMSGTPFHTFPRVM